MEFITNTMDQVNWWAIIVATLSTMPVGYVWYDLKMGFGKRWAKLVGLKEKDMQNSDGMASRFAVMLLLSFISAVLITCLVITLDISGLWNSLIFGVLIGFFLRGAAHFIHNGFSKKSSELSWIDAGHDTVSVAVMTIIISLWR
jgi:hypothetical protein